jgi:hypothetical protein
MTQHYEDDIFCDKNDKLELLINNNIFVNIGFISFLNRCIKGFDRVIVNYDKKTTLKDYMNKVFPVKKIDNIILKIKNKELSKDDYFHIESMLNSYLIEHKIKKIRFDCKLSYLLCNQKKIFYNDHGHFMRMVIAMSFLKRFTTNEILQMAHIYFDFIHANVSYINNSNKKFNLKCNISIFSNFIDYHPNLEFFFINDTQRIINEIDDFNESKTNEPIQIISVKDIEKTFEKNKNNQVVNAIYFKDIEKMLLNNYNMENDDSSFSKKNFRLSAESFDSAKKDHINKIIEEKQDNFDDLNEEIPYTNEEESKTMESLKTLSIIGLNDIKTGRISPNGRIISNGRMSPVYSKCESFGVDHFRSRLQRYINIYS